MRRKIPLAVESSRGPNAIAPVSPGGAKTAVGGLVWGAIGVKAVFARASPCLTGFRPPLVPR